MVKKSDFYKVLDMPSEREKFILNRKLTNVEIDILKEGHIAPDMDDRWFFYYEDGEVYFHRSWTGICIYIVSIKESSEELEVTVNRNSEQYTEKNIEVDKEILNQIIDLYIKWARK